MIRDRSGFTLVELLVVMTLTVFVLAAASRILVALITQFKQQSKIAETNIESLVGLEIMRDDIKTAGYGLPWGLGDAQYDDPAPDPYDDDWPSSPRAVIVNSNAADQLNNSDVLVIKSMVVGRSEGSGDENLVAGKWHTYIIDNDGERQINTWMPTSSNENLDDTDRVVVHQVIGNVTLVDEGAGATQFQTEFRYLEDGSAHANFHPANDSDYRLVYGLVSSGTPLVPYHVAGFYISGDNVPERCASNTGVLVKVVLDITDGSVSEEMPLLDCVADMQVIFAIDNDGDGDFELGGGSTDGYSETLPTNASDIRKKLYEVRVYVLAHEGQYDSTYTHRDSTVDVGEFTVGHVGASAFNLSTTIGDNWENYRWRVYRIAERQISLRGE
jgi:prepilin-type N-terminal cleavage/methylation domain-containing protein